MEQVEENEKANGAANNEIQTVTKYVREIRVNYRGPKREPVTVWEAKAAADFVRKILPDNSREHFVALYLDGASQMIGFAVTSTGTANYCPAQPLEVFQRAVLLGAVSLVVAHNHPSGCTEPSSADVRVTRVLKEAGDILGVKLLDHIIINDKTFRSFAERGEL